MPVAHLGKEQRPHIQHVVNVIVYVDNGTGCHSKISQKSVLIKVFEESLGDFA